MKLDATQIQIRPITAADAEAVAPLTFPAYRHLLDLEPARILEGREESQEARAYGLVAELEGRPAGLVLAVTPDQPASRDVVDEKTPQILSISVAPAVRRRGIGRRLIAELELQIEGMGWHLIQSQYSLDPTTGHPVSRLLDRQAWEPSQLYNLIFKSTVPTIIDLPVCRRMARLARPRDIEAIPWGEVTTQQLDALHRWNAVEPWIPRHVGPELHHPEPLAMEISKGLIHDGRLAGWILGHRMSSETFRLTYSYMHPRLSRRGKILPFWIQSMHDCAAHGYRNWWWSVSPFQNEGMFQFAQRHLAPNLPGEVTESHHRVKRLFPENHSNSIAAAYPRRVNERLPMSHRTQSNSLLRTTP